MTEMTEEQRLVYRARNTVHNAIMDLGCERGAEMITRERIPGMQYGAVSDLPPIDGLKAAREIQFAALYHFRDYMRQAREAGHSWRAIGEALDLGENAKAREITVADAAFDPAAGDPDSHYARTYGRSVTWRCACEGLVSDHGDEERGHKAGCERRAREAAEREREPQREWGDDRGPL